MKKDEDKAEERVTLSGPDPPGVRVQPDYSGRSRVCGKTTEIFLM